MATQSELDEEKRRKEIAALKSPPPVDKMKGNFFVSKDEAAAQNAFDKTAAKVEDLDNGHVSINGALYGPSTGVNMENAQAFAKAKDMLSSKGLAEVSRAAGLNLPEKIEIAPGVFASKDTADRIASTRAQEKEMRDAEAQTRNSKVQESIARMEKMNDDREAQSKAGYDRRMAERGYDSNLSLGENRREREEAERRARSDLAANKDALRAARRTQQRLRNSKDNDAVQANQESIASLKRGIGDPMSYDKQMEAARKRIAQPGYNPPAGRSNPYMKANASRQSASEPMTPSSKAPSLTGAQDSEIQRMRDSVLYRQYQSFLG
jgi:hypothetical protein